MTNSHVYEVCKAKERWKYDNKHGHGFNLQTASTKVKMPFPIILNEDYLYTII